MAQPDAKTVLAEIQTLTSTLVGEGLVDDQEWPILSVNGSIESVDTPHRVDARVLKGVRYERLYDDIRQSRMYNFLMLDKAVVQLSYEFDHGSLVRHRLAFLPSPALERFQDDPDLYLQEIPWAEVVGQQATAVPIRFDFDIRAGVAVSEDHPAAHLTLGQYRHCRIPVNAPITPGAFVDFIVRHFYGFPGSVPVAIDALAHEFAEPEPRVLATAMHLRTPTLG